MGEKCGQIHGRRDDRKSSQGKGRKKLKSEDLKTFMKHYGTIIKYIRRLKTDPSTRMS